MTKYLIPISIVIAGLIIGGAVVYDKPSQPENVSETPEEASPKAKTEFTIAKEDHVRGSVEAKVTIVEFSDFQCPYCQAFHLTVKQVLAEYPNDVRWVYKHFPLDSIHPQARPSAEAAECVAEQKGDEGFWQFADGLFENQSRLGAGLYTELAESLDLNLAQFGSCVSSRKYQDRIEANLQEGVAAGVRGTPGSFVNGEAVSGAVPYETLKAAVEKALSEF